MKFSEIETKVLDILKDGKEVALEQLQNEFKGEGAGFDVTLSRMEDDNKVVIFVADDIWKVRKA